MIRDIRYAIRALLRTPTVTVTALVVLALGIGATTAIFGVAHGVLLRPLPFAEPDRLVHFDTMGLLDFEDVRAQSRSFESMVAYQATNKNLSAAGQGAAEPERIAVVAAERALFDLLGVRPLAGRLFAPNDATTVAVVSEGFWQRRFGGRPSPSDWAITLDGEPYTVVGIMPAPFQFPYRATPTDVWIPMALPRTDNRFQRIGAAVARLRPDVPLDTARAELRAIAQRLETQHAASNQGRTVTIVPLTEAIIGRSRTALLTLVGAVAMVMSPQGRYFQAIEQRVKQIPGVRAAGFTTLLPIQSAGTQGTFAIVGRPVEPGGRPPSARLRQVSPDYFRALGIPLRAGRFFAEGDDDGTAASGVLVNETLVRRHFPGEDAIGRVLDRGTIIGVVSDVRQSLRLPPEPEIYSSLANTAYSAATLVVSASIPPEGLVGSLRAAIREVNPNQAVYNIGAMESVITASHADLNLYLSLIGAFAGLALVLSMAGIYGVMAYAVASRRKEFGIRLALGADAGSLLRLVLSQGGVLIVAGVAIGAAGAVALTRFLRALLYGVTATDPVTFVAVALLLGGVAVVACLNPARRAMKVDPLTELRAD